MCVDFTIHNGLKWHLAMSNFHWAETTVAVTLFDFLAEGEWQHDNRSSVSEMIILPRSGKKNDNEWLIFTFQVTTSECHEAGGDEVVHVLASAAQVFFPIVAWWKEKCGKWIFQQHVELKEGSRKNYGEYSTAKIEPRPLRLSNGTWGTCMVAPRLDLFVHCWQK